MYVAKYLTKASLHVRPEDIMSLIRRPQIHEYYAQENEIRFGQKFGLSPTEYDFATNNDRK